MSEPWAYIAHKNGYWAGIASPEMGKKELRKFLGEFAADGFAITTVINREEYDAFMSTLQHWHKSPEYQAKRKPVPAHPDLFQSGDRTESQPVT